jgi:hypothetical protein
MWARARAHSTAFGNQGGTVGSALRAPARHGRATAGQLLRVIRSLGKAAGCRTGPSSAPDSPARGGHRV